MHFLKVAGKNVELNDDGFLSHPEDWSEDVARAYAVQENMPELTDAHWRILYYLREYYHQFQIAPMIRKLCKDTGYTFKQVEELFPSGPAKGACKLAGLPKPTGCL